MKVLYKMEKFRKIFVKVYVIVKALLEEGRICEDFLNCEVSL